MCTLCPLFTTIDVYTLVAYVANSVGSAFIVFIMFALIIVSVMELDLRFKNLAELSINIRQHN